MTAGTYRILGIQSKKFAYNVPLTISGPYWNSITFETDGSHPHNNSLVSYALSKGSIPLIILATLTMCTAQFKFLSGKFVPVLLKTVDG